MNQIEIISQPKTDDNPDGSEIAQKLQDLVSENPPPDKTTTVEQEEQEKSSSVEQPHKTRRESTERISSSDLTKEKLDHDGFEIPQGKIPLDGHFSTNEVQQLVELAKSENLIKENVHVEVVEKNESLGDKLVIKEVDQAQVADKKEENNLDDHSGH